MAGNSRLEIKEFKTKCAAQSFRSYYERQLQMENADFNELMSALDMPLPITFRLVGALQGYDPDESKPAPEAFDAAQAAADSFHEQLSQVFAISAFFSLPLISNHRRSNQHD